MKNNKKVVQKDGAIYTEELYDQRQKVKKIKEPKYPFREVRLNQNTILLVNITKSEKQQEWEISLYRDAVRIRKTMFTPNFEII